MKQKEFAEYWKKKKSDKSYLAYTPYYDKKDRLKLLSTILTELMKVEDFRKLDYEQRIEIMENVFGNNEQHYKKYVVGALKGSIKTGLSVETEKEILTYKETKKEKTI